MYNVVPPLHTATASKVSKYINKYASKCSKNTHDRRAYLQVNEKDYTYQLLNKIKHNHSRSFAVGRVHVVTEVFEYS